MLLSQCFIETLIRPAASACEVTTTGLRYMALQKFDSYPRRHHSTAARILRSVVAVCVCVYTVCTCVCTRVCVSYSICVRVQYADVRTAQLINLDIDDTDDMQTQV